MAKKTQEIQFQMRISSINVLKFSQYDIEALDLTKDSTIEFQSDFGVQILEKSSEIAIETTVKLKIQELDKYYGELKTLIKFSVDPFAVVVKKNGDNYQIPDMIMMNLFNIAAGTLRGILFEKLRGTVLQKEILPLIDVRELLKSREVK